MSAVSWPRRLWIAAGVLALVAFLFLVRDILPPFLIAFALAALFDPLLDRMQRWGWSRRSAALITFLVFLAVFLGLAIVLLPLAIQQAGDLVRNVPSYYDRFSAWARTYVEQHRALLESLRLPTTTTTWLENYHEQIQGSLQSLVSRMLLLLRNSLSKVAWLAIIPIVTFYLMQDIDAVRLRALSLLPTREREWLTHIGNKVGAVFIGYLRGLCIVCAGYAVVNGLVLSLIFHLPYALVIGLLSGILYAVPYIGAVATIALGALVALTAQPSTGYVVGVALALLATNQVFDQLVTPRIVGGLVGLHPVLSLFALTAGGSLFGLLGMILAVPVAASIRVVLIHLFPALVRPLPTPTPPPRPPAPPKAAKQPRRWGKKKR